MICNGCGKKLTENVERCPVCGKKPTAVQQAAPIQSAVPKTAVRCPKCGKLMTNGVCSVCGENRNTIPNTPRPAAPRAAVHNAPPPVITPKKVKVTVPPPARSAPSSAHTPTPTPVITPGTSPKSSALTKTFDMSKLKCVPTAIVKAVTEKFDRKTIIALLAMISILLMMIVLYCARPYEKKIIGNWKTVEIIENGISKKIDDESKNDYIYLKFEKNGTVQLIVSGSVSNCNYEITDNKLYLSEPLGETITFNIEKLTNNEFIFTFIRTRRNWDSEGVPFKVIMKKE